MTTENGPGSRASRVADDSYNWYRQAAIKSRRFYRASEMTTIGASALVPVSAAILPGNTTLAALLGAIVVIVTGARGVFHWHENYLRFSRAREAVAAEQRRYHTRIAPYDDPNDRDAQLTEAVIEIEQNEMGRWIEIAAPRSSKRELGS